MEKSRNFLCLDAMRGVAAVVVLLYHTSALWGIKLFPAGHLAVDFFFMLSGFVLTYAYQQRIDNGHYAWEFVKTRVIRLYPLYIAGSAIGLLHLIGHSRANPGLIPSSRILQVTLFGLFLIPPPALLGFTNLIPLDEAAWSLFGEVVANILHVTFLRRRPTQALGVLAVLLWVTYFCCAKRLGTTDFGFRVSDSYLGLTRVLFSYVTGMLVFRLYETGLFNIKVPPFMACAAIPAILTIPSRVAHEIGLDIALVTIIFPALLLLGAQANPSGFSARFAKLLGLASYAIYILHLPLTWIFHNVWLLAFRSTPENEAPWSGIAFAVFVISVATVGDHVYDAPIRKWLAAQFLQTRRLERAQSSHIHIETGLS